VFISSYNSLGGKCINVNGNAEVEFVTNRLNSKKTHIVYTLTSLKVA